MDDERLRELFASLSAVGIKRMFGGQAIYSEGNIVAVVVGGELMMKADALTAPLFEAAGSVQWTYGREGKSPVRMPYWSLPDSAYEDPEAMMAWAKHAAEASRRRASGTKRRKKTPPFLTKTMLGASVDEDL